MSNTPLRTKPGIVKVDTAYASKGRYIDGDKVRFVHGRPQKIGGNTRHVSTQFAGKGRRLFGWRDTDAVRRLALGTSKKLYVVQDEALSDVTPQRFMDETTLTNKLSTTNSSATVSLERTGHGLLVGDWFYIVAGSSVGGLTIKGNYQVLAVTDVNNVTFTHTATATSTVAGGGGSIEYGSYRKTLTNPFSTTNASTSVSVAHTAHGEAVGDYVTFANASAVGGITINGEYTVTSVTDANTYVITHSAAATSTVAGGGGTVYAHYDIPIGADASTTALGYGTGRYGEGTWGSPRTASSFVVDARIWFLDQWGEYLIACPQGDLYEWRPDWGTSVRAKRIAGSPRSNRGVFVTENRNIVALGMSGDPLKIGWSDDEDHQQWSAAATNTANNGRRLNKGSYIVGAIKLKLGISLIFTDTSPFVHQYTGDEFVYTTRSAGDAGLVGPAALCERSGVAYWASLSDFYMFDGVIRRLPSSEIRQYAYGRMAEARKPIIAAGFNSEFNEVWFWYQSSGGADNDEYVAYDPDDGWIIGTMGRSAWLARGVFEFPIAAGTDGYLYRHEEGTDDNGAAMTAYIERAPDDTKHGAVNLDIFGIEPDFKDLAGSVALYLLTKAYPQSAQVSNGPYAVTTASEVLDDVRVDGRMVGFKVISTATGCHWRLGEVLVDAAPTGGSR